MRAITDAREFSEALNRLSQLLPQSSIPALEGVYVRFSGGRCNLTATDLSTWLTVEIPAQGEPFDPAVHNAVMHCEDEALGENTVAEVFQAGFKLGDKIIRHAMVKVAN